MSDFVEVLVTATGRTEVVPSHFLDDEILGKGIERLDPPDEPQPVPPPVVSDVQLTGPVEDLPLIPAAAEAVLAARAAEAAGDVPTEDDTHAVIDKFAEKSGIDLGAAKTKAEKVAVINAHLDTGGIEPSAETPAAGEEEN